MLVLELDVFFALFEELWGWVSRSTVVVCWTVGQAIDPEFGLQKLDLISPSYSRFDIG